MSDTTVVDLTDQPLGLHPRVALRREPFGALAYHYDNRRLNFLRSHELVELVRSLDRYPSAHAAFAASGLEPDRWPAFSAALSALATSGFLELRRSADSEPEEPR